MSTQTKCGAFDLCDRDYPHLHDRCPRCSALHFELHRPGECDACIRQQKLCPHGEPFDGDLCYACKDRTRMPFRCPSCGDGLTVTMHGKSESALYDLSGPRPLCPKGHEGEHLVNRAGMACPECRYVYTYKEWVAGNADRANQTESPGRGEPP